MYTNSERYSSVMDNIDPLIHWVVSNGGAMSSIQIARSLRVKTSVDVHQHDIIQSLDRLMRAGLAVQLSDGRYSSTVSSDIKTGYSETFIALWLFMLVGFILGFLAGFMVRSSLLLL